MKVVLLLVLVGVSIAAGVLLLLIIRARNKRLLLDAMRGPKCDAPGSIGISVLCSGVADVGQIESLLSVEYARYEVVVALDAQRYPEQFAELAARYRIIRVEWAPTGELCVGGVRSVGRSRKRCYRRLVLMDRKQDDVAGDFDAAAEIATYDYLLPVGSGQYLLRGGIERLVAEIGGSPAGTLELIRTLLGVPAQLIAREAVVAAGGFSMHPARRVPPAKRRTLWEPMLVTSRVRRDVPREVRFTAAAALAAGIVASAAAGLWPLTATLATAALLWAAAGCAARLLAAIPGVTTGSFFPPLPKLRKIGVKNFTIS